MLCTIFTNCKIKDVDPNPSSPPPLAPTAPISTFSPSSQLLLFRPFQQPQNLSSDILPPAHQILKPISRQEIMIRELESRHDGLRDQSTIVTLITTLDIRQEETGLVLATLDDPLQPLSLCDIMTDDKGFDGDFASRTVAPICMDNHIPRPTLVQRVDGPASVAVEIPYRRCRRDQVVDGRAGVSCRRRVLACRVG